MEEQPSDRLVDQRIRNRIMEAVVRGASSPGFFKLKSLAHNYDKIKRVCDTEKGPYIYKLMSNNRLKKVL